MATYDGFLTALVWDGLRRVSIRTGRVKGEGVPQEWRRRLPHGLTA